MCFVRSLVGLPWVRGWVSVILSWFACFCFVRQQIPQVSVCVILALSATHTQHSLALAGRFVIVVAEARAVFLYVTFFVSYGRVAFHQITALLRVQHGLVTRYFSGAFFIVGALVIVKSHWVAVMFESEALCHNLAHNTFPVAINLLHTVVAVLAQLVDKARRSVAASLLAKAVAVVFAVLRHGEAANRVRVCLLHSNAGLDLARTHTVALVQHGQRFDFEVAVVR